MRRPALAILTLLGVLILLGLGTWQVYRLHWKLDLIERAETRAAAPPVPLASVSDSAPDAREYRAVVIEGGFPTDAVAHVFGTADGEAGWFVFQPIQLDTAYGGAPRYLLFNRGFVAQDARRSGYPLPENGPITGLVRAFERPGGIAGLVGAPNDADARSYYDRSFETLSDAFSSLTRRTGGSISPDFYVDSTMETTLPRGGTTRLTFSNRHLGYAITWYGLAAALVGVYVILIRRR